MKYSTKHNIINIKFLYIIIFILFSSTSHAQGFPPVFEVGSVNGLNGVRIDSGFIGAQLEKLAFDFKTIGDINDDGISDIALGFATIDENGRNAGGVLVVFGRRGGLSSPFPFFPLRPEKGFAVLGASAFDLAGSSISAAGDINHDGIDDMIIGASGADVNGLPDSGASYVVFGRKDGFAQAFNLSDLDGSNGFAINGSNNSAFSGSWVSKAGDVNGDGIDDVIIGAPVDNPGGRSRTGAAYVVFGHDGPFAATFDLSSLDGTNGFVMNGVTAGDEAGARVSAAGDINHDGIDDVLVSKTGSFPRAGAVYVVFGKTAPFDPVLELSSLDGANGFTMTSPEAGDVFGARLDSAGDVNGDGIDDVVIGALLADPDGRTDAGSAYVVFGRSGAFASQVDVAALDGSNGFRVNGVTAGDEAGTGTSAAGDFNGDGLKDILIGARNPSPGGLDRAGAAYVIYGKDTPFAASLELSALDGSNGVTLNGPFAIGQTGTVLGSAGDFNGDSVADIAVGTTVTHDADVVIYGVSAKTGPTTVFSSVLPAARSGFAGGPAITVFASVINAGANRADNCHFDLPANPAFSMSYTPANALNALVGPVDSHFLMNPGETKSFILSFQPSTTNTGEELFPKVVCDNALAAKIPGVNTVLLSIDSQPGPDILSISATPDANGIITVPAGGSSFMSVSATNIGAGDAAGSSDAAMTVSVESGNSTLPLLLQLCETDAAGQCMQPPGPGPLAATIGSGVSFFGVFATDQQGQSLALDPANLRVVLKFADANGNVRSQTSAAVRVQ